MTGFGFIIGCVAGTLGIGGGLLMIPALSFIAPLLGLPHYPIHLASGLSAVHVLGSSSLSTWVYINQRRMRWQWVWPLGIGSIAGGLLGGVVSKYMPEIMLYSVFVGFLIMAFLMTVFRKRLRQVSLFDKDEIDEHPNTTQRVFLALVGFIVGFVAANIGVGGSVLVIPILMTQFHQRTKHAIANAAGFVMLTAVASVVGKAMVGLIPLPEAIFLTLGSISGGLVGARANRFIPSLWLRTALATVIMVSLIRTLFAII
ncbi:MAG: sulfite exporter TauE/SafE family protein [Cyanobacteria bacterium HKST-UBA04]|nr:sulfite exporter TauE/SafE family protein [Cyanobacteria bacterium HKST-UBA04]MCA9842628.1 sulfite exporter TauE/SafE family protein [Cyanobacteria bacterium HKST-UBA03]